VKHDGAGRCQFRGLSYLLADEVCLLVEEGCEEFGPHIRLGLDVVEPVGHFTEMSSLQAFKADKSSWEALAMGGRDLHKVWILLR
jgi:hypothetical protein